MKKFIFSLIGAAFLTIAPTVTTVYAQAGVGDFAGEWCNSLGDHWRLVNSNDVFMGKPIIEHRTAANHATNGSVVTNDNGQRHTYYVSSGNRIVHGVLAVYDTWTNRISVFHREARHNYRHSESVGGIHIGMTMQEVANIYGYPAPHNIDSQNEVKPRNPNDSNSIDYIYAGETWYLDDQHSWSVSFRYGIVGNITINRGSSRKLDSSLLGPNNSRGEFYAAYGRYWNASGQPWDVYVDFGKSNPDRPGVSADGEFISFNSNGSISLWKRFL